jgi:hypothetical protein
MASRWPIPTWKTCRLSMQTGNFGAMTGYTQEETIGKELLFPGSQDQEQAEKLWLHKAIKNAQAVEVTLKN